MKSKKKKKLSNAEKLALTLGLKVETFDDGSATWVTIDGFKHSVELNFDSKGKYITGINISKNKYDIVDSKVVVNIEILK